MPGPKTRSAPPDRDDVRLGQRALGHPLHGGRVQPAEMVDAVGLHRAARAGGGLPPGLDDEVQVASGGHQGQHLDRLARSSRSRRRRLRSGARHGERPARPAASYDCARVSRDQRGSSLVLRCGDVAAAAAPPARLRRGADLPPARALSQDGSISVRLPRARLTTRPAPATRDASSARWLRGGGIRGRPCQRDHGLRRGGGRFRSPNCHGVMRTVGRTYAARSRCHHRDAHGLPAEKQRPGVHRGLRTRARHRSRRASTRSSRARRRGSVGRRHALSALQLRPRIGHAFMRIHGDRLGPALTVPRARAPGGARLRPGRVSRLLVRGRRRRRGDAARTKRDRPAARAAAGSRSSSCGHAGTARSSRPGPAAFVVDLPWIWRDSAGARRAPARGLHHRRPR